MATQGSQRLVATHAPAATILLRLLVGTVFLSEGLQKFLHPALRGAGRLERIGLPVPELLGPVVGAFEMASGLLVLLGLLTRLAVIPLIVTMLVALFTTKLPILLGTSFLGFQLREVAHYGLLGMLHESRTDLSMLLCSLFLLIVGAGPASVDRLLSGRSR